MISNNKSEHVKAIETQKKAVSKIRITVDSLTNELVAHLNKINRLLAEIEQNSVDQQESEETQICKNIRRLIADHC